MSELTNSGAFHIALLATSGDSLVSLDILYKLLSSSNVTSKSHACSIIEELSRGYLASKQITYTSPLFITGTTEYKAQFINILSEISNLGLVESKHLAETLLDHNRTIVLSVTSNKTETIHNWIYNLRSLGLSVDIH